MSELDEIFDVVDSENNIIGKAPRCEVHSKSLMHRSSHILVFDLQLNLFLQKRSLNKDENPGLWDTSAAGHVEVGEDYLHCAKRELEEELGLVNESLTEVMCIRAQSKTLWEHVRVYKCITDSNIIVNNLEISEGRYWKLPEINIVIESHPNIFTETFHLIFNNYININE